MIRARLIEIGRYALLVLLAVFLQAVFASQLPLLGVRADIFVITVVLVAVGAGSNTGLVFGFIAGLTADVVFLEPVGTRAFLYLLAGYGVGRYVEEFGLASAWVVVVLAAVASLASQGVYGVMQIAMGAEGSLFLMIRRQMIPSALFGGLLAAPLYLGFVRLKLVHRPREAGPLFS